jgi:hypothetical protein
MAQATTSARAPRGTKTLAKAFFTAADEVPATQRDAVIKAALVTIRDEMKASRVKATAAKRATKIVAKAPAKKAVTPKRMGRPVGSKNKPKVVEAPVAVAEEVAPVEAVKVAPKAAKKAAPKAKAPKQAPVELLAAE